MRMHSQAEGELERDNGERRCCACLQSCFGRRGGGRPGRGTVSPVRFQSRPPPVYWDAGQHRGPLASDASRTRSSPFFPPSAHLPLAVPTAHPETQLQGRKRVSSAHPPHPPDRLGCSLGTAAVCLHPDPPPHPHLRQRPDPLPPEDTHSLRPALKMQPSTQFGT